MTPLAERGGARFAFDEVAILVRLTEVLGGPELADPRVSSLVGDVSEILTTAGIDGVDVDDTSEIATTTAGLIGPGEVAGVGPEARRAERVG